jgi:predicted RNase H-like nuclease
MERVKLLVGVDGARGGWFCMWISSHEEVEHEIFPDIQSLWTKFEAADDILIDIPLGLVEAGMEERICDRKARRILGKGRGSSVFRVPCRPAVYSSPYPSASSINKGLTGKSLSKQSWNITPKIREVDQLLISNERAKTVFKEVHPELSFWGLNNRTAMTFNKKCENGFQERVAILDQYWENASGVVEAIQTSYSRKILFRDDIVDAFAILLMGRLPGRDLCSLHGVSLVDEKGITMEILVGISKARNFP